MDLKAQLMRELVRYILGPSILKNFKLESILNTLFGFLFYTEGGSFLSGGHGSFLCQNKSDAFLPRAIELMVLYIECLHSWPLALRVQI